MSEHDDGSGWADDTTPADEQSHEAGHDHIGADDPGYDQSTTYSDTQAQTESHGEGHRMDWIEEPQSGSHDCGPTSIAELLTWFSGDLTHPYTEDKVVTDADQMGLLTDTGMSIPDVAKLLTAEGLPSHLEDASAYTQPGDNPLVALDQYLDEGRGVILAVDSKEIWYGEQDVQGQPDQDPDHALIVTQINFDPNDPHGGTAVLEDSGQPGSAGVGETVPLDTLLNAWSDSNYAMIVTDDSPPWYAADQQAISDVPADQPQSTDPSTVPADVQPQDQPQQPVEPAPQTPAQVPAQASITAPWAGRAADSGFSIEHAIESHAAWGSAGLVMLLPVGLGAKRLAEQRKR